LASTPQPPPAAPAGRQNPWAPRSPPAALVAPLTAPLAAPLAAPPIGERRKKKKKRKGGNNVAAAAPAEVEALASALADAPAQEPAEPALTEEALEEAREEARRAFDWCIDDIVDSYASGDLGLGRGGLVPADVAEKTVGAMGVYRAVTGAYPYDYYIATCAPAFELYLSGGALQPEIFEDIRRIVTLAIKEGDRFPWAAFRDALVRSGRNWRDWYDRELYIRSVGPGGARALCEAAQLGFVDHRLEHAVTTIQRLVRYRRSTPAGTAADFERLHHQPEPAWKQHGIHLRSFSETGAHFSYNDDQDEASFVSWNRRCIPEFISEIARGTVDVNADYEFSMGIPLVVGEDVWEAVLRAIQWKRADLYHKKLDYLLDDDALAKTGILIRLYAENRLHKKRDARRDVLKFVRFTLNERAPVMGAVRDVAVAKCYLDRVDALPLHVASAVFRALPACLATHGCDLVYRFGKADLDALGPAAVRRWFLDVIIDEAADVCEGGDVSVKDFKTFLSERIGDALDRRELSGEVQARGAIRAAAELARSHLKAAQARVRAGKPLYEYSVWVEPVKVEPVLMPSAREAELGRK